jgi:hypothetical protein
VNEESERILAERTIEAMKPKAGTIYIPGDTSETSGFIQPGTIMAQGAFKGFIVSFKNGIYRDKPNKPRKQVLMSVGARLLRRQRLLGCQRMNFLIGYLTVSGDTTTGA